jgi:hypothetical protein
MTTRGRTVYSNQTVVDQADFFQSDGYTRVTGLLPSQLVCQFFFNNKLQTWPLISGANLTDMQIVAGSVYWWEVPGSPGIYSVRWRPNAVGYWRLLISYPAGLQTSGQDYDVNPIPPVVNQGLQTSFVGPGHRHGHHHGD